MTSDEFRDITGGTYIITDDGSHLVVDAHGGSPLDEYGMRGDAGGSLTVNGNGRAVMIRPGHGIFRASHDGRCGWAWEFT
jgi:hypothetical protein